MTINLKTFRTVIQDAVIDLYNEDTYANWFNSVPIPDGLATDVWGKKYVKEGIAAALGRQGLEPNELKMDEGVYEIMVASAAIKIHLSKKDIAVYEKFGTLTHVIKRIKEGVVKSVNQAIFNGLRNVAGYANAYNYLLDPGTGSGTPERPLAITTSSAGAWGTFANVRTDVATLVGDLEVAGFDPAQSIAIYPRRGGKRMRLKRVDENGASSVKNLLMDEGIRSVVSVKKNYFQTQAGANPTSALFDLGLIDLSAMTMGYTENLNLEVEAGQFGSIDIKGSIGFCLAFDPEVDEDGNIVKGVSLVTACSEA